MNSNVTGFNSSNGLVQCVGCGRLTWEHIARTEGVNGEACKDCAREWEAENDHYDNGAQHPYSRTIDCPICHPETREARRAKVDARNAELRIKAESYSADRKLKADAKAAAQAAKDAATKFCVAPGCDTGSNGKPGRASKTSDYCTFCRPYNKHDYKRGGARLERAVAHIAVQYRRFPEIAPGDLCDTCGNPADDALHASA
jgi:hypothetical protein